MAGRTRVGTGAKDAGAKTAPRGAARKAESRKGAKNGRAAIPPPNGAHGLPIVPVKARPSRAERAFAEERQREIDDVCSAWAAIVAERMAADQDFAEIVERYGDGPTDLRGLFLWDALQAAESHLAVVNGVIARNLGSDRRADPFAILAELRLEQRRLASVYGVNAFLAVLNQMSPNKPKWVGLSAEIDERIAVLSLAHQTLGYALETARVSAPDADLTDRILRAAQHEAVWALRRAGDTGLAACAAAAAFFSELQVDGLGTTEEVASLYTERARARGSSPPPS